MKEGWRKLGLKAWATSEVQSLTSLGMARKGPLSEKAGQPLSASVYPTRAQLCTERFHDILEEDEFQIPKAVVFTGGWLSSEK